MATDLMTIARPDTAALIFVDGGTGDIVSRIEEEARALVADASTAKGRKAIASNAAKVARSKTYLDGLGKDLVAGLKKQTQAVDAERREMRNRLDALKVEVRKPLTDYEMADEKRQQTIKNRIREMSQEIPVGSDAIAARMEFVQDIAIDKSWEEFAPLAAMGKDEEIRRLRVAHRAAVNAEKAEAERLEAEKRARVEREKRIADEAAAKAKAEAERIAAEAAEEQRRKQEERSREAERNAAAAALAKERELIEAQRQALEAEMRQKEAEENARRQAKQAAEAARQEVELAAMQRRESEEREAAAIAAEARRKAEDKAHRAEMNCAALEALQNECGLSFDDAKMVVVEIAKGKIPGVSINY